MIEFFTALALAIVIEGIVYAAFPEQMKRALETLLQTPNSIICAVALTIAALGIIMLFILKGWPAL